MATAGAETRSGASGRQFWGNGRAGSYRFQAFETAGPRTSGRMEFAYLDFGWNAHSAEIATIRVRKLMNVRGLGSSLH
jgi:hypothetical protein